MIPQRYEVKSWNEWDGVSLRPAEDGALLLYADAEKWVQEEIAKKDEEILLVCRLVDEKKEQIAALKKHLS